MKSDSVMRRFQESLEVTRSAKKQIWQVLVFLLIVAGLLYYVSTRALDVVRLGTWDIRAAVEDGEDFFRVQIGPGEGAEGADGSC